ncbi:MAG TPA: hypothetical protein PLV25_02985 [Opitutales bacterium]|nr:hypothetical protein [Opitutales bacterium]
MGKVWVVVRRNNPLIRPLKPPELGAGVCAGEDGGILESIVFMGEDYKAI